MSDKIIEYPLNNKWVLWCHSLTNNNWDLDSYNKIYELNNLYDYKTYIDSITLNDYHNSMFFLMRDTILPIWEDENNIDGCSLTLKVPNSKVKEEWDKLTLYCIIEDLNINIEDYKQINGISISPKKEFNILKIWFKTQIDNLKNIEKLIKLYKPYLIKENIKIKKYR